MTLRELEYAVALADHGHFGRAAEACNVSQPTLSGQLRKLEEQLGVTIFERGRRGTRLTDVGQELIEAARDVLSSASRIEGIARAAQDPLSGELSLGFIPTIAPYLIPKFVSNLQRALPNLSIIYREDVTERLNADLLAGRLDAAILATPPETDGLRTLPLYTEAFQLVLPQGHRLDHAQRIAMDDLDVEDMLLLTEGHCFRDQALSICRPSERRRRSSLRATSLETLVNLVAEGQGITLVPKLAHHSLIRPEGLVVKDLNLEGAARDVNLTFRSTFPRTQLLEKLADIIRDGVQSAL